MDSCIIVLCLTHFFIYTFSDYIAIPSETIKIFSSSSQVQTLQISIVNDSILEMNEVFQASLTLVNAADADRVMLQPSSASVTIVDEDGKYT